MPSDEEKNCKEMFAILSDYLDFELPPDSCQVIERHLADCPRCVEFAESLRKTIELCRGFQPQELPGPIAQSAREQLLEAYRKAVAAKSGRA